MGAVNYLPYAHSKTDGDVAVWNGAHAIIDRTTGANVTCGLQRPNGLWYKLVTPSDLTPDEPGRDTVPAYGRYMSAALVNLLSVPPGYAWGPCTTSTDQPGRRFPDTVVVSSVLAAAVLAGLVARVVVKRRRLPGPVPPVE